MRRDPRDTSADRQRRTLEAPNGARVVMPVGTSEIKLLDQQLIWIYVEPMQRHSHSLFPLRTPLSNG